MITNLINKKASWEGLWNWIRSEFFRQVVLDSNASFACSALKEELAFCSPISALWNTEGDINLLILFWRSFQMTNISILVHDRCIISVNSLFLFPHRSLIWTDYVCIIFLKQNSKKYSLQHQWCQKNMSSMFLSVSYAHLTAFLNM